MEAEEGKARLRDASILRWESILLKAKSQQPAPGQHAKRKQHADANGAFEGQDDEHPFEAAAAPEVKPVTETTRSIRN